MINLVVVRGRSGRLRWWAFLACLHLRLPRLAAWLLIDRRPLTPEEILHGQAIWERIQKDINS